MIRSTVIRAAALPLLLTWTGLDGWSQSPRKSGVANASTATHASAELRKGRLDPGKSKPGDEVTLELTEDVRSNGQVILKKGTPITGVVRSVKRVDGTSEAQGQANSMMEIGWLAPLPGKSSPEVMIALQWVSQVNPASENNRSDSSVEFEAISTASPAAAEFTSTVPGLEAAVNGRNNIALMSMPSVVAADSETATSLADTFGMTSGPDQLFRVGQGEVIGANGSRKSIDIFSYMSNDTVLTSESNSFEISTGAQMNLLVGVRKN